MLDLFLHEQILSFVKHCLLVEERQIYKFFRNTPGGKTSIAYEIDYLSRNGLIHEIAPSVPVPNVNDSNEANLKRRWSIVRRLNIAQHNYTDIMKAVDVMTEIPAEKIMSFEIERYPFVLTFEEENYVFYDVQVFNRHNWVQLYADTKFGRTASLPDHEADPTNHIAVVDDMALIPKIQPLGYMLYAMVDRNGHVDKWSY